MLGGSLVTAQLAASQEQLSSIFENTVMFVE
jgi:hypothetical protein